MKHCFILSHRSPMNPSSQTQCTSPKISLQIPPFLHGLMEQTDTSGGGGSGSSSEKKAVSLLLAHPIKQLRNQ